MPDCFPKQMSHFTPTNMLEVAHLLQLSASLHLSFHPPFPHSDRCKIVSVYVCISLVINLVEHFFVYLLSVCILLPMKCLFCWLPILLLGFCLFPVDMQQILESRSSSDHRYCRLQKSSPSLQLLFSLFLKLLLLLSRFSRVRLLQAYDDYQQLDIFADYNLNLKQSMLPIFKFSVSLLFLLCV